jgi:hypothetical protein
MKIKDRRCGSRNAEDIAEFGMIHCPVLTWRFRL